MYMIFKVIKTIFERKGRQIIKCAIESLGILWYVAVQVKIYYLWLKTIDVLAKEYKAIKKSLIRLENFFLRSSQLRILSPV